MHGREAKRELDNAETSFSGMVYGPGSHSHHSVNRDKDDRRYKREKISLKVAGIIATTAVTASVGTAVGVSQG